MQRKNNPIGDYLRVERAKLRLSQAALSKRSGVTQANLSLVEGGLRRVGDSTLERILAKGFGLTSAKAKEEVCRLRVEGLILSLPRDGRIRVLYDLSHSVG